MSETLADFRHQNCYDCRALPHCGAGQIALRFIKDAAEPEIDLAHHEVIGLTRGIFERIYDKDNENDFIQACLGEIIDRTNDAMSRYDFLYHSIDKLIGDVIVIQDGLPIKDYLLNIDGDLVESLHGEFAKRTSVPVHRIPTVRALQIGSEDALHFRNDGECQQFSNIK
jgi:hypothetical protein